MGRKRFLFISPHLDDAVLSCGAYIGKLRKHGFPVCVLTIFSGSPSTRLSLLARKLHADWRLPKDAPAVRREEDSRALHILGADIEYAGYLDCIYRRDQKGRLMYRRISQVLQQDAQGEAELVDTISCLLLEKIRDGGWDIVFAPLALGGHVDHLIVKDAVLKIEQELPSVIFHYYEDLPYVINDQRDRPLPGKRIRNYVCYSSGDGLQKNKAMHAYRSQIKCSDYPDGIDIDAITLYGKEVGRRNDELGERIWYAQDD